MWQRRCTIFRKSNSQPTIFFIFVCFMEMSILVLNNGYYLMLVQNKMKLKRNDPEITKLFFSNHRSHALMYWPNIHGLDGMGQIKWASTFGMYADSWCEMMVIWSIITTRKFTQIAIEDLFFFVSIVSVLVVFVTF